MFRIIHSDPCSSVSLFAAGTHLLSRSSSSNPTDVHGCYSSRKLTAGQRRASSTKGGRRPGFLWALMRLMGADVGSYTKKSSPGCYCDCDNAMQCFFVRIPMSRKLISSLIVIILIHRLSLNGLKGTKHSYLFPPDLSIQDLLQYLVSGSELIYTRELQEGSE
jgi:hypothetical protein